jgi:hypothetical protein
MIFIPVEMPFQKFLTHRCIVSTPHHALGELECHGVFARIGIEGRTESAPPAEPARRRDIASGAVMMAIANSQPWVSHCTGLFRLLSSNSTIPVST